MINSNWNLYSMNIKSDNKSTSELSDQHLSISSTIESNESNKHLNEQDYENSFIKEEENQLKTEKEEPSGFFFPSYDDFFKILNDEENNKLEHKISDSATEKNDNFSDILAAFQTKINSLSKKPSNKNALLTDPNESAEFHCIRLTAQIFSNPFQALSLTSEATEEEIKQQFRKISLMIHPDKCKHPKAREAFQVLSKANEQLKKPEMRKKYEKVIIEAKKLVLKERIKQNKQLKASGKEQLPEDEKSMNKEIMEMCDQILKNQEERRRYAEQCKAANERYEKEQNALLIEESVLKREEKRKWEDSRNERVNSWRNFKGMVEDKKIKLSSLGGIRHYKEERIGPAPKITNFTRNYKYKK